MLRNFWEKLSPVGSIAIAVFLLSLIFLLISPSPSAAYLHAIYRINADGSDQTVLLKDSTKDYRNPAWSPDGTKIAYIAHPLDTNTEGLYLANADGKNQQQLTLGKNDNYYPVWSPDSKVISFAVWNGLDGQQVELHVVDLDSKVEKRLIKASDGSTFYSSWSPDGKQIAYDIYTDNGWQIFTANSDGTDAHHLANGGTPDWSPNGLYIVFVSNRDGNRDIFVVNSDGSNERRLTSNSDWDTNPVWSPDGQQIVFISGPEKDPRHIFIMNDDGSNQHRLTENNNGESNPTWSPDGRQIVFASGPTKGPKHIFIVNEDGSGIKDLTPDSDILANTISWSLDGRQIIFDAIQSNAVIQEYPRLTANLRIKVITTVISLAIVLFTVNRGLRLRRRFEPNSISLNEALSRLDIFQNPILEWLFRILPWALILIALIGITPAFNLYPPVLRYFLSEDPFYNSGIATAGISLLIFQILQQRIPESFRALWNRKIILRKTTSQQENALTNTPSEADNTEDQYREFVDKLCHRLNDPRQAIAGVICGLLGASWIFFDLYLSQAELASIMMLIIEPFFIVQFLISFGIGYVVGLQVGRMIVIGYAISQLGKEFDLAVQLGHPDGSGGLAPLGNLCLWNALIVSPAGIDLGAWLIFENNGYEGLLYFLLLVVLAIASFSFFAPLWNVHKIMESQRDVIKRQLDQLSQNIYQLARELLEKANELTPDESENIAKKLDRMRQTYQDNQQIATWPFNTRTLAKFITSQIVPLLSLTGLGQPLKEAVVRLVDFFQ